MKNVLARGGIEFIAVLLGITGSLLLDGRSKEVEIQEQINSSLVALVGELNSNVEEFDRLTMALDKGMPYLNQAIKAENLNLLKKSQLDSLGFRSTTPWGRPLNRMVYKSLEASGLIYNIRDDSLRTRILNLYEKIYVRYQFLIDYELNDIKKLDNVFVSDFVLRDDQDPKTWWWPIDWSNKENIRQFKENTILRNHFIVNRGNKRILKGTSPKFRDATQQTINAIKEYLDDNKQ